MTRPGIEPRSPGPLANTLTAGPMSRLYLSSSNKTSPKGPIISKTQQNSKCRLCSDTEQMINHIINECSKLTQNEYKTRHDWVEKAIHWGLCKKLEFEHTNKWYMYKPESVLENETHKSLCDFEIQMDHLSRSDD